MTPASVTVKVSEMYTFSVPRFQVQKGNKCLTNFNYKLTGAPVDKKFAFLFTNPLRIRIASHYSGDVGTYSMLLVA